METITLTKQEYHRKMFEAYKEGFKSAIDTLQGAFSAVEGTAQKSETLPQPQIVPTPEPFTAQGVNPNPLTCRSYKTGRKE